MHIYALAYSTPKVRFIIDDRKETDISNVFFKILTFSS